jgi:hypothetical protein
MVTSSMILNNPDKPMPEAHRYAPAAASMATVTYAML